MSVINTNIKSLVSQNAMVKNNRDLADAMQQLSTGKRINSAKDDAAGLAISSRMTAQITGLDQAVRNGNDAVSMLQTTEGAMIEMTNMLQRMRELAVQSSNDTYTAVDRGYLDLEFQQLKTEVNRITDTTEWNGMAFLNGSTSNDDGTVGKFEFQVGANNGQIITHTIADMGFRDEFGSAAAVTTVTGVKTAAAVTAVAQQDTLTLGGTFVAGDVITVTNATGGSFSYTVAVADNDNTKLAASLASAANAAFGTASKTTDAAATNTLVFTAATAGTPNGAFTITNTSAAGTAAITTTTANTRAVAAITTAIAQKSEVTLSGTFIEGDKIELKVGTNATASIVVTKEDLASGDSSKILNALATRLAAQTLGAGLTPTVSGAKVIITGNADGTSFAVAEGFPKITSIETGALKGIRTLDIKTNEGSNKSLVEMDVAINRINSERAGLGAVINRLNYAVDNLANVSMNTSESRSRIMDADYAKSSSELARTQIISQAATAMLAQANQQPQTVLQLLQG